MPSSFSSALTAERAYLFCEVLQEALITPRKNLDAWFFTKTAIEIAQQKR